MYFNILRQKVPYFNVSRQNRVLFNCFATKQCWGMLKMWGQPLFCNQPSKCTTATYLLLCISFMNNSQTKSSGYNEMQRRLIVSVSTSTFPEHFLAISWQFPDHLDLRSFPDHLPPFSDQIGPFPDHFGYFPDHYQTISDHLLTI